MYLSKGGRVTLIKESTLEFGNLFSFLYFQFQLSGPLHEKLQQDFLFRGEGEIKDDFKFHLVNWAMTCTPIQGELGVQNLLVFQQEVVVVCGNIKKKGGSLWRTVIESIYGGTWEG